jgi:hypothetical protein
VLVGILPICPLGLFYGYLVILWSFGISFPHFGSLYQEKSGNPDADVWVTMVAIQVVLEYPKLKSFC